MSPGHPGPTIAVVVGTRDRAALLADSLRAITSGRRRPDRLVVVDSASVDPEVGRVARAAGAEVVRCERPGLGWARNAGLARVTEDVVAFTDDDCLADPGWLQAVADALGRPDGPCFATGQVRSDVEVHRRAWLGVSVTETTEPRTLGAGDDPRQFGHGANMGWRRDALERIGGFDDWLGVGSPLRAAEDVDAWARAVDAGCTGCYVPAAVVVHRQWRDRRQMLRSYHGYGIGAGALAVKRYRRQAELSASAARRALARDLLVEDGPVRVVRALRRGHRMAALADSVMAVGAQRGAWRARRFPVVDGRFAPPGN